MSAETFLAVLSGMFQQLSLPLCTGESVGMCSQVITEKTLVEQSGSFEQAVMSNDKAALADFCASKASQAHNPGRGTVLGFHACPVPG